MTAGLMERKRAGADDLGPCPTIRTPRLTLRPHRLSDARAGADALGDFSVGRMLLRVPRPYHPADARDWLDSDACRRDCHLAITRDGADHIGVVSVERRGGGRRTR